ncbi:MAG TPA: TIGR03086 family metal-binding protein [Egibacteraceae bacterium]|nr:TIGR03086 family metal-binding protein [Egibacteraceae bacterium]
MDIRDLHRRACEGFAATARAVRPDQWGLPTPCTEWDVRALVNHVVAEDRWTSPLVEGRTVTEIGDRFDGDLLGDDPAAACAAAAAEALDAVGQPGVLERIVHLSYGDVPAPDYVSELFADHLVHRWDLATAIGADARLDADLVAACATWFAERESAWRQAGVIGPRLVVSDDADAQTRLLAAFGRSADQSR